MIPDAIVANNDWLRGTRTPPSRSSSATGRGWAWCRDNQEACAELSRKNGATGGASHEAFVPERGARGGVAGVHGYRRDRPDAVGADRSDADAAGLLSGDPAEGAYRIDLAERATEQLDELGVDKLGRQWEKLDLVPEEGGA